MSDEKKRASSPIKFEDEKIPKLDFDEFEQFFLKNKVRFTGYNLVKLKKYASENKIPYLNGWNKDKLLKNILLVEARQLSIKTPDPDSCKLREPSKR